MHIHCSTEHAIFLLGVFDKKKVMRFPDEGETHAGVRLQPSKSIPIDPQLLAACKKYLVDGFDNRAVSIYQEFDEVVTIPGLGETTVYLGVVDEEAMTAPDEWAVFPDIIRRLPKDRTRLPYLKAWQVLTGGLKLDTRAIENADLGSLLGQEEPES
jgi:hypothetical protein